MKYFIRSFYTKLKKTESVGLRIRRSYFLLWYRLSTSFFWNGNSFKGRIDSIRTKRQPPNETIRRRSPFSGSSTRHWAGDRGATRLFAFHWRLPPPSEINRQRTEVLRKSSKLIIGLIIGFNLTIIICRWGKSNRSRGSGERQRSCLQQGDIGWTQKGIQTVGKTKDKNWSSAKCPRDRADRLGGLPDVPGPNGDNRNCRQKERAVQFLRKSAFHAQRPDRGILEVWRCWKIFTLPKIYIVHPVGKLYQPP